MSAASPPVPRLDEAGSRRRGRLFLGLAALGLAGSVVAFLDDPEHLLAAWLVAWAVLWMPAVGMLFFVLLHHVTDSGWSTVFRRWAEQAASALPLLGLLLLPLLVDLGAVFPWLDERLAAGDEAAHHKAPYLNLPFFLVRISVYVATWWALVRLFRRPSLEQDEHGDATTSLVLRRRSGPALVVFGLVTTGASIDLMMSLDHHWYSTIYGVYVFSQGVLAALAVLVLLAVGLRRAGHAPLVPEARLADLARLLFAMACFWAYIAFSQAFLIWYANLPEETTWLLARGEGPWPAVGLAIGLLLFAVPFVVLMPAAAKSDPRRLVPVALLVLVGHVLGTAWLLLPTLVGGAMDLGGLWVEAAALLALGGVVLWWVERALAAHPLRPRHDPRATEAT